jgi:hypothetical protein
MRLKRSSVWDVFFWLFQKVFRLTGAKRPPPAAKTAAGGGPLAFFLFSTAFYPVAYEKDNY